MPVVMSLHILQKRQSDGRLYAILLIKNKVYGKCLDEVRYVQNTARLESY